MREEEFHQTVVSTLATIQQTLKGLERQVEKQNGNVSENRKDINQVKLDYSNIFPKIDYYLNRFEEHKIEHENNEGKYASKWTEKVVYGAVAIILVGFMTAIVIKLIPNAQF